MFFYPKLESGFQQFYISLHISFSQCDNKEIFIEKIKEMDVEMQQLLVPYIQEVCGCKFLFHLIYKWMIVIHSSSWKIFGSHCSIDMKSLNKWSFVYNFNLLICCLPEKRTAISHSFVLFIFCYIWFTQTITQTMAERTSTKLHLV